MSTINSQELFYIVNSLNKSKELMQNLRLTMICAKGKDVEEVRVANSVINELDELLDKLTNVNNKVFTVERD